MYILKKLKQDTEFASDLSEIIDMFKSIASAEFFRMQATIRKEQKDLLKTIQDIIQYIPWHNYHEQLFLKEDLTLPSAFVALGTDESFSGGLNTSVMTELLESRKSKNDEFLILGERAARYLEDMRESFTYFGSVAQDMSYERSESLVNFLWDQFKKRKWGRVFFVYPHFISVTEQKVLVSQVLPYKPDFDITASEELSQRVKEIILEPSAERVIDYIIRLKLVLKVQGIFYSTKLSEFAARMVHLEGSGRQLTEWQKELRLEYFKKLHELRDCSIREIFASRVEV